MGPLPLATPPKEMAVFALITGVTHRSAAYGYRSGSFFERRDFPMAGTLVKHPHGDLLIDTGFGRNINEQFRTMPLLFRAMTSYKLWQPAVDQLRLPGTTGKHYMPFFLPMRIGTMPAAFPTFKACPCG